MRKRWWLLLGIALVVFVVWLIRTDRQARFRDSLCSTLRGYLEEAERRGDIRLVTRDV